MIFTKKCSFYTITVNIPLLETLFALFSILFLINSDKLTKNWQGNSKRVGNYENKWVFCQGNVYYCGSHHYELITGSQQISHCERRGAICFIWKSEIAISFPLFSCVSCYFKTIQWYQYTLTTNYPSMSLPCVLTTMLFKYLNRKNRILS